MARVEGKDSELRTARKGLRDQDEKDSEVRTARKGREGQRGKEGKDGEVRTARKGMLHIRKSFLSSPYFHRCPSLAVLVSLYFPFQPHQSPSFPFLSSLKQRFSSPSFPRYPCLPFHSFLGLRASACNLVFVGNSLVIFKTLFYNVYFCVRHFKTGTQLVKVK